MQKYEGGGGSQGVESLARGGVRARTGAKRVSTRVWCQRNCSWRRMCGCESKTLLSMESLHHPNMKCQEEVVERVEVVWAS